MIDFEYLYQGLCGLANAHPAGTMAGHLGAAVVAGYFFGEDQSDLPDEVYRGVEGELNRIIAGEEAIWFNAEKTGIHPSDLFQPPTPDPDGQPSLQSIVAALDNSLAELRQSGHNVIFASIALRALHDHQEYQRPEILVGIRKLIDAFAGAPAGRGYYGAEKGWLSGNDVRIVADQEFPEYRSLEDLAEVTIRELLATAAIRKQGFGGLWHIINHAAAIIELKRYGYESLAQKALTAHHRHIQLWRSLPDLGQELGPVKKAAQAPDTAAYWQENLKRDQARLTHRIKTLYGFQQLQGYIANNRIREQAHDAFLYLMA
ncbi:MAG: hypothetical protein NXI32_17415 [bacterium]|nr:hypothetical protein [bacterium]